MNECEYLVGYGVAGEFGRFRSVAPSTFSRGDRVVVRTHRGVEAGQVLRPAAPGHARFLPNTTVGQLLRAFAAIDEGAETNLLDRGRDVWKRASELVESMSLPIELLDVEVLLDGEHVVLHYLGGDGCDVRPFVSTLSREFSLHVLLTELNRDGGPMVEVEAESCGSGCGSCGSEAGGCGSCGTGGGCESCGVHKHDAAHFAELRKHMEEHRTSLL